MLHNNKLFWQACFFISMIVISKLNSIYASTISMFKNIAELDT